MFNIHKKNAYFSKTTSPIRSVILLSFYILCKIQVKKKLLFNIFKCFFFTKYKSKRLEKKFYMHMNLKKPFLYSNY